MIIACSHDASQLFVFPLYDALRDRLDDRVGVSISTHRDDFADPPAEEGLDLILSWRRETTAPQAVPEDAVTVFREEVQVICSTGFAASHADILHGPVAGWGELTFLDMERPNAGWISWSDWFDAAGGPAQPPRYEFLDSYIQVLEAAANGDGIALGWRHYIERYLQSGAIVLLGEGFVEFGNRFVATLTVKGRGNPSARECLSFFGQLA